MSSRSTTSSYNNQQNEEEILWYFTQHFGTVTINGQDKTMFTFSVPPKKPKPLKNVNGSFDIIGHLENMGITVSDEISDNHAMIYVWCILCLKMEQPQIAKIREMAGGGGPSHGWNPDKDQPTQPAAAPKGVVNKNINSLKKLIPDIDVVDAATGAAALCSIILFSVKPWKRAPKTNTNSKQKVMKKAKQLNADDNQLKIISTVFDNAEEEVEAFTDNYKTYDASNYDTVDYLNMCHRIGLRAAVFGFSYYYGKDIFITLLKDVSPQLVNAGSNWGWIGVALDW